MAYEPNDRLDPRGEEHGLLGRYGHKILNWTLGFGAGIILLSVGFSSFYTLGSGEVAVVKRLGHYTQTVGPGGLHMKAPWGIDRPISVDVQKQQKLEFGYLTLDNGEFADLFSDSEGIGHYGTSKWNHLKSEWTETQKMFTGDLNLSYVQWAVHYRIVDPVAYALNTEDPKHIIMNVSESVMRGIVGDRSVDEVLTNTVKEKPASTIGPEAKAWLNEKMLALHTGVEINEVYLQNTRVPPAVQPDFELVNAASPAAQKAILDAEKDFNQKLNTAMGEAEKIKKEAEGYAFTVENAAKGDAGRFMAVLAEYQKSPDITAKRMLLEALATIFRNAGNVWIVSEGSADPIKLLNLTNGGLESVVGGGQK